MIISINFYRRISPMPRSPFSSPQPTILLACGRNRELWEQRFWYNKGNNQGNDRIGHFRVPLRLCFKASLSAKPFLWKWLICMRMKLHAGLIFIWKVSQLDSFWNSGTRELGNGLFCPSGFTQSSSMAHAWNGCSQSSRFLLQARRIVGSGDENARSL